MLVVKDRAVAVSLLVEPADEEDHRGLEPLRHVHREELHRVALALEPLHVAVLAARTAAPVAQGAQSRDDLGQGEPRTPELLEQALEEVQVVGQRALAGAGEDLAAHEAAVVENAPEEPLVAALVGQHLPGAQGLDERALLELGAARQLGELQAEERGEPGAQPPARVVRVGDRLEQVEHVVCLLGLKEALLLVEGVVHSCGPQRLAERVQLPARTGENVDVAAAQRARPQAVVAVEAQPGVLGIGQPANLSRDARAEHRRHRVARHRGDRGEVQHVHRRERRAVRAERGELRVAALDRLVVADGPGEEGLRGALIEDAVVAGDEIGGGAEVATDDHPRPARAEHLLARGEVGVHVGAAEGVDRLLRVADEVEPAAPLAEEEQAAEDRPLRLVGVLELVDEREAVALAQQLDERRAMRPLEAVAHQAEHVLEVELPALALAARDALGDPREEARGDERLQRRDQVPEALQWRHETLPARPLGQLAEPLEEVFDVDSLELGEGLEPRRQIGCRAPALQRLGERLEAGPELLHQALVVARHLRLHLRDGLGVETTALGEPLEALRVEGRLDARLLVVAAPERLLQIADAAALGEEEPQQLAVLAVGGEVLAQRVAEGRAEGLASVHQLLVEEPLVGEGVLGEHAAAEGVDGADGGRVEPGQRLAQQLPLLLADDPAPRARHLGTGPRARLQVEQLLQDAPHPRPKLAGRLLGEGDHEDLANSGPSREQDFDDEVLEGERLAGAGRGLDDRVAVERDLGEDRRPLVARGGGHS